jgi:putative methyltransferase (TIGR04325 family)
MNIKFNWMNYNLKRNKEANKIHAINLENKINYLEKGVYQNIRDIYALALLISNNQKKKIKILDYGGNLMSHVNLRNKIETKNMEFFVFNPYSPENIKNKTGLKIKFIKELESYKTHKFDLIYFGSVLQYISNLKSIRNLILKKANYVLITHTPIKLGNKSFISRQKNEKNLIQNIHTLEQIKKNLLYNIFKLVFKSINDYQYSGLRKKYKDTHSLNLLFKNSK